MKVCTRKPWGSGQWWRSDYHISSVAYDHTNCICICSGVSVKGCGHESEIDKKRITLTSLIKENQKCFCVTDSSGGEPVSCCSWTATEGLHGAAGEPIPFLGRWEAAERVPKLSATMACLAYSWRTFQPGGYHLQ